MQSTIRRKVESGVTALLILTLGGFAFAHQGVPAEEVDLNDGGVWVTNTALGMTGHLNYQSRIIDGGLNAPTRDFDISQEGNQVLLQDKADKAARPIDTVSAGYPASRQSEYDIRHTSRRRSHASCQRIAQVSTHPRTLWPARRREFLMRPGGILMLATAIASTLALGWLAIFLGQS